VSKRNEAGNAGKQLIHRLRRLTQIFDGALNLRKSEKSVDIPLVQESSTSIGFVAGPASVHCDQR
jgi:hypothetical protein